MGCASNRKKQTHEFAETKWEYISLDDFKSKGCGAYFAYGYLWFMLFISIAVYAVDSFTAVNLIVFNKWSSKIEPTIPFDVSKWIFSVCIILSFVNLAFEAVRTIRVMKRGNVAECFMDTLAVRWESIRFGSGKGWKRFLVFAELTKSKKGSEYVALFTYFSFKSWIRVIFCSGPRQVVNALTLRSVYVAKLAPTAKSVDGAILGFFDKIKALAVEDYQQAVILSGMCFTFVVWAFSAIFLLTAVFFYVLFLFHWIPRADGGLTGYCVRKVNKKLLRIVTATVNKALAKGQRSRDKAEYETALLNGEKTELGPGASLPTLPSIVPYDSDNLPQMPMYGRDDKSAALPMYSSRPASPGNIEMSPLGRRPTLPRPDTGGSVSSYASNAPLISSSADMGYGPPERAGTLARPGTGNSQRSLGAPRQAFGQASHPSAGSYGMPRTASPAPMNPDRGSPFSGQPGSLSGRPDDVYGASAMRSMAPSNYPPRYQTYNPDGRQSPAPSVAGLRTGASSVPPMRGMRPYGGANQAQRSWTTDASAQRRGQQGSMTSAGYPRRPGAGPSSRTAPYGQGPPPGYR